MQECAFHVEIFILLREEEPSRDSIDHNSDSRHPGDCITIDGNRMGDFVDTFEEYGSYSYAEEDGISEGCLDGDLAIAVGLSLIGCFLSYFESNKRD